MAERKIHRRILVVAVLVVGFLAGCNREVRMAPAVPFSPAMGDESGGDEGPVFEKIPPDQNPMVIPADEGDLKRAPYRLEVEDVLDISVYGEETLQNVEVPVRPDGMISFAFIGDVPAAGRTVEEVRQEMIARLAKYLRTPEVMIIAKQFAQKKVFIGGEVKQPGVYYLGGREGTLLDALYKVGLVTDKADLADAFLMRGNELVAADFQGLVRGDMDKNIPLRDLDLIYVPERTRRFVYVLGLVKRSDAFEIKQPVPIIEILAKAGGVDRRGDRKEIAVIRGGLREPSIAVVNAKKLLAGDLRQNIMINPGDIVYVPRSGLGAYLDTLDVILRSIAPIVQGVIVSEQANP